jgi:hypothetical protein
VPDEDEALTRAAEHGADAGSSSEFDDAIWGQSEQKLDDELEESGELEIEKTQFKKATSPVSKSCLMSIWTRQLLSLNYEPFSPTVPMRRISKAVMKKR